METVSKIRRWVLADGLSIHEVSRRTGLSRNTIRKYVRSGDMAQPRYRQSAPRPSRRLLDYEVRLRSLYEADLHPSEDDRRSFTNPSELDGVVAKVTRNLDPRGFAHPMILSLEAAFAGYDKYENAPIKSLFELLEDSDFDEPGYVSERGRLYMDILLFRNYIVEVDLDPFMFSRELNRTLVDFPGAELKSLTDSEVLLETLKPLIVERAEELADGSIESRYLIEFLEVVESRFTERAEIDYTRAIAVFAAFVTLVTVLALTSHPQSSARNFAVQRKDIGKEVSGVSLNSGVDGQNVSDGAQYAEEQLLFIRRMAVLQLSFGLFIALLGAMLLPLLAQPKPLELSPVGTAYAAVSDRLASISSDENTRRQIEERLGAGSLVEIREFGELERLDTLNSKYYWAGLALAFMRLFGFLFFLQAIAWLMVRQYRRTMDDYKFMYRTVLRRKNYDLVNGLQDSNLDEKSKFQLVQSILSEDLQMTLAEGQSTEALESAKFSDVEALTSLSTNFAQLSASFEQFANSFNPNVGDPRKPAQDS